MSGIAIETEFQLLNARLSSIADNLEVAEERIWQIIYTYLGSTWDGEIDYPSNFALHNIDNEIDQLAKMKSLTTLPEVQTEIDSRIAEMLNIELSIQPSVDGMVSETQGGSCPVATQDVQVNLKNRQTAISQANYGPMNPEQPNKTFWMAKAQIFGTTVAEAKTSRCGNCAAFDQTPATLACIDSGIGANGGATTAWDTIAQADLGYCSVWDFKCAATRTCDAWITGGPIKG
jgi:hypothetical protein